MLTTENVKSPAATGHEKNEFPMNSFTYNALKFQAKTREIPLESKA